MSDDGRKEIETGDKNGHCALLVCGMQVDGDEKRIPPDWSCALIKCGHQGGGRSGGPLTWQFVPTAHIQGL